MLDLKIGLIGAGFIGRSHALAIGALQGVFGRRYNVVPWMLAEANQTTAGNAAEQFGFLHATDDWRKAVASCDAIVIAVPSHMHREVALAAIAQGKHILCEKPVGLSAQEADEIRKTAEAEGVTVAVGFTYMRAPLVRHAKNLLDTGALGAPLHFKGWHCEDYLASPDLAFSWRQDASLAGRCGALGDMGWHIIAIAQLYCGSVQSLSGDTKTFHKERPVDGQPETYRTVENEDWAAATLRFASGATGSIEVSRVAHGKKMDIGFELICESGSILYSGERSNEIKIYTASGSAADAGFRTVMINEHHPDYSDFISAPGHGLGFNDLKTIELRDFVKAIEEHRNTFPDLTDAVGIARICEAILASADSARRIDLTDPQQDKFKHQGSLT